MTAAAAALVAAFAGSHAAAQGPGVDVENRSRPTLCAEVDNVYVTLAGGDVDRFTVTAQHPAYIGTIVADSSAADHANCNREAEQYFEFDTRRVTLYEDRSIWLIGYVYERYWLTKDVPVRVGDRVEHGLHMIQLWRQGPRGPEEFLVLYPPDGYWRLRPLTPEHLHQTAYGSSVLIGPVEEKRRPVVEISSVTFDPQARAFELTFDRGGRATISIEEAEESGTVLNVAMEDVEFPGDLDRQTFAALRSMYVAPGNADVSAVGWRSADDPFWTVEPLPEFGSAADVRELWLGRNVVSRHNTSAPDIVFGRFEGK
ncbi:hypothetical protein [Microbaculum marinum]|uniref:Uncharacterized protein n=1 Tax=Microbaculum marinum TaxID=1764581 RepID=A0AAW9RQ67_9HYPH